MQSINGWMACGLTDNYSYTFFISLKIYTEIFIMTQEDVSGE
jgi:hypothetical protein